MHPSIDTDLICRCIKNERKAQRALYDILLPYLENICRRYLYDENEVEDLLQVSFVHIFSNLSKFDVEKAGFRTWATKITINNCLKRNRKKRELFPEEIDSLQPIVHISPDIINKLALEDLLRYLKKMPANYFEVFNLYVLDGYSHEEIAQMLDIEPALSRKRLSRARMWLNDRFSSNCANFMELFTNN